MNHIGRVDKKDVENFTPENQQKKERRTRVHAKTAEVGCVLGAGGGGSGWRRMRADGKGRSEQGRGGRLLLSLAKMEGRTCLACRLGQLAAERHWRSLAPRHALRRAQPCLVAKTFGTLTKNGEVSTRLTSPFLAGAEGLGLRSAPVGS